MEHCCVDNTSPHHRPSSRLSGPDDSRLYISINPPQPGGTWASTRSPPVTGQLEQHTNDLVVMLFHICSCQMLESAEPFFLNKGRDWRAASSFS